MAVQPGLGAAIYWKVAQLAAPQLVAGLLLLREGMESLEAVPADKRAQAERDLVEEFLATVPDPNREFQKIDLGLLVAFGGAAAAAPVVGGAVAGQVGLLAAQSLGTLAVIATALEAAGIADTIPDDGGLRALVARLMARAAASAAVKDSAGVDVPDEARIAKLEAQIDELALAEVEYERLRCHLRQNVNRYGAVIWTQYSSAQIGGLIAPYSLPPHLLELDFAGFVEDKGVLRVVDPDLLPAVGFNWGATRAGLTLGDDDLEGDVVTLPTSGIVVEPAIGECSACDEGGAETRELERQELQQKVRRAKAEARYQELECERLEARIAAKEYGDPTPREPGNE